MRLSSDFDPNRRLFLAGAAALPVLLAGSVGRAQPAATFSAVAVDVGPLVALGDGGARLYLQPALLEAMREVFADRITGGRGGPILTARITSIYLAPYDGQQTTDAFGGNDNIEGDGIVSSRGQVLSTTHILTELPPTYSGALVTQSLDQIRYRSIAHQFAYWLRREMGI